MDNEVLTMSFSIFYSKKPEIGQGRIHFPYGHRKLSCGMTDVTGRSPEWVRQKSQPPSPVIVELFTEFRQC
jgi:hypothetical protein